MANFQLNRARFSVPTNESMYDCVNCLGAGITHEITRIYKQRTYGYYSLDLFGETTATFRKCTGCGAEDGPWVEAYF